MQVAQLSLDPKPENQGSYWCNVRYEAETLGCGAKSQSPKAGKPEVLMSHSRKKRNESFLFPFLFYPGLVANYKSSCIFPT